MDKLKKDDLTSGTYLLQKTTYVINGQLVDRVITEATNEARRNIYLVSQKMLYIRSTRTGLRVGYCSILRKCDSCSKRHIDLGRAQ